MLQLSGHSNKLYQQDLDTLYGFILEMGEEVEGSIQLMRQALRDKSDLVEQAKQLDKEINALERKTEDQATLILSRHQPVMEELRFVIYALKLSSALERMGDMAKNTVKRIRRFPQSIPDFTMKELDRMVDVVLEMLHSDLAILKHFSPESALKIYFGDAKVDEIHKGLFRTIQQDIAVQPDLASSFGHILFAAKNLERMADHAADAAGIIYYINEGRRIKADAAV